MPQGPLLTRDVVDDATGYIANITATAGTVLKGSAGRVCRVLVVAASTAPGVIYDCAALASTASANKVFTVPATVGVFSINWPCTSGITVFPGAGMTLSVSLS